MFTVNLRHVRARETPEGGRVLSPDPPWNHERTALYVTKCGDVCYTATKPQDSLVQFFSACE